GQRGDYVRNPHYWMSGLPYLSQLSLFNLSDPTARVNALADGQVLVIDNVPTSQIKLLTANPSLRILRTHTGHWQPINMNVSQAPFTDVRVRQAMRLIADRPQLLQAAAGGYGKIGNDLFGYTDPLYAGDMFPQRHQDIEQAKFLLKQAGQENLT